jgi:hypothetical protein
MVCLQLEIASKFIPVSTTLLEAIYCLAYLKCKIVLPPLVRWRSVDNFMNDVHFHMTSAAVDLLVAMRSMPSSTNGAAGKSKPCRTLQP